jgi:hypothetical protein
MFTRAWCSTAVANTQALKLAVIFDNPPQMDDGEIVVDEKGIPTGLLKGYTGDGRMPFMGMLLYSWIQMETNFGQLILLLVMRRKHISIPFH